MRDNELLKELRSRTSTHEVVTKVGVVRVTEAEDVDMAIAERENKKATADANAIDVGQKITWL